jgi:hypothetical protein
MRKVLLLPLALFPFAAACVSEPETVSIRLIDGFESVMVQGSPPAAEPERTESSDQSGRGEEVYVRPFPPDAGSNLVQVSADGGTSPVWAHNGRELFYRNGSSELVVVPVSGDVTFTTGPQEVLFLASDYLAGQGHAIYDVSPDDQEFVMLRIGDLESDTELILVENWAEELAGRVGN